MNAFDTLIEHAQERYPHFENERGQNDIQAAIAERKELESIIKNLSSHLESILNIAERNHPDLAVLKEIRPHAEAFNILEAIEWSKS